MTIHWFEQSMNDVPAEEAWLSVAESNHLRNLRFAKRRADWLLGRWTAKNAVATSLGLSVDCSSLAKIEIRPALSGAPQVFFKNEPALISISLSHRNGVALCALAAHGVLLGCDLEAVEPHSDGFAADYFSPEEQVLVRETLPSDRERMLSLLWSSKESALKASGEGLRVDTREIVVSVPDVFEQQNQDAGSRSEWRSRCIRKLSRDNSWHPLQVRAASGQALHGWWSQTAELIRTILAVPPPDPPTPLTREQIIPVLREPDSGTRAKGPCWGAPTGTPGGTKEADVDEKAGRGSGG